MKRGMLRIWAWGVVGAVGGVVAADYVAEQTGGGSLVEGEVLGGLMGVAAGVLAIVFQRRAEFVTTVRAEWAACLAAIAKVRSLYHRRQVEVGDYLEAYTQLWTAIDGMRSVYRDHGESSSHVGYYPFATLHDIRLIIEFDFANGDGLDEASRRLRLDQIEGSWRLFRYWFLRELETPEADGPILTRLARDERAYGVGFWDRLFRRLPKRVVIGDRDLTIKPEAPASGIERSPGAGTPTVNPPVGPS